MINFEYYAPTKVFFGKGRQHEIGSMIAEYGFHKILLHYGSDRIKKSGLYDEVVQSLQKADIEFVELSGVVANPRLSLVEEGIRICREQNIELVLAVGGGSVIDSAKAIGCGYYYDGPVWDFFEAKASPQKTLPVGVILTIAAAGSEMSNSMVITKEEGLVKRGINNNIVRPLFAVLNPELTYTLPPYQTACGIVDILMHTIERYFTNVKDVELTDLLAEGLMKSVIEAGKRVMRDPYDYEARATLMWASSLSHNDLTGAGRQSDFASHKIELELSGMYDVAHGAGLAVIFPAWAQYVYQHNPSLFAQFAVRVFHCPMNYTNPIKSAQAGIRQCQEFFSSLGMPVTMAELGVPNDKYEEMADKCTWGNTRKIGNFVELDKNDIIEIYKLAEKRY